MSTPAARSAARAARQRRYRRRLACGQIAVTLTLPEHAIATALIETRRLSAAETADRAAVARELSAMLVDWAERWAEHVC